MSVMVGELPQSLELGLDHVHPEDTAYTARVDVFSFAMQAVPDEQRLRLFRVDP
jgi:hypothetical protein